MYERVQLLQGVLDVPCPDDCFDTDHIVGRGVA